jgi:ribosomal protein S14
MSLTTHRCVATGCKRVILEKFLMCPGHWRLVPKVLQTEIWREYFHCQRHKVRTIAHEPYMAAINKAITHVASAKKEDA